MKNMIICFVVVLSTTTNKFFELILEKIKKIFLIGGKITAKKVFGWVISYFFAPQLIKNFGYIYGFFGMFFISLVIGYLFVRIYDYYKVDFFEFNKLRLRENPFHQKKRSKKLWLIILLLMGDSFFTVLYVRDGDYNGFSRKTTIYFILSTFLIELSFFVLLYSGISVVSLFLPNFTIANLF